MNIVDSIRAVRNTGDDKTAWNQAKRIQFLGAVDHRNISPVEVGRNFVGRRRFEARLLGAYFIQQPTENQSYKQPFDQRKWFFLKCGNRSFIVSQLFSSAIRLFVSKPFVPIYKFPSS